MVLSRIVRQAVQGLIYLCGASTVASPSAVMMKLLQVIEQSERYRFAEPLSMLPLFTLGPGPLDRILGGMQFRVWPCSRTTTTSLLYPSFKCSFRFLICFIFRLPLIRMGLQMTHRERETSQFVRKATFCALSRTGLSL